MSLNVYLIVEKPVKKKKSSGIFVPENGQLKEISKEEWKSRYPTDPIILEDNETETITVYSDNITHNLGKMAEAADLYHVLWCPHMLRFSFFLEEFNKEMKFEDTQPIYAKELIDPLRNGLHKLKMEPEKYKQYNPKNGWGDYEILVKFVENYLNACYEYPETKVEVIR